MKKTGGRGETDVVGWFGLVGAWLVEVDLDD